MCHGSYAMVSDLHPRPIIGSSLLWRWLDSARLTSTVCRRRKGTSRAATMREQVPRTSGCEASNTGRLTAYWSDETNRKRRSHSMRLRRPNPSSSTGVSSCTVRRTWSGRKRRRKRKRKTTACVESRASHCAVARPTDVSVTVVGLVPRLAGGQPARCPRQHSRQMTNASMTATAPAGSSAFNSRSALRRLARMVMNSSRMMQNDWWRTDTTPTVRLMFR